MTTLMHMVVHNYNELLESKKDPMVDSWLFMSSPVPVLTILACYLYFVLKLGPDYMATRKPYNLQWLLIGYNFYQVVFSLWLCTMLDSSGGQWLPSRWCTRAGYFWGRVLTTLISPSLICVHHCDGIHRLPLLDSRKKRQRESDPVRVGAVQYLFQHGCQPVNQPLNPFSIAVSNGAWWYFFSKIVELLDTVFFVLRKKQNQVTFLHVYHHTITALFSWGYLKFLPGEQGVVIGFLNSMVHVVMYFYYLVAALGPKYQKYLWWKKYMTTIQLVQFCIMLTYLLCLLAYDCKLPKALTFFFVGNVIIFLYLFYNFYKKAYKKEKRT